MIPLTPEQFYEKIFKTDYLLVKSIKHSHLYNFNTMMMFTELYKNYLTEFYQKK